MHSKRFTSRSFITQTASKEELKNRFIEKLINKLSNPKYKPTGLEKELIDSILKAEAK